MPAYSYPRNRPAFFAQKFTRAVFKACVANEIGQDATLLILAIAATEDAKKYSGAVTYHNGQLLPVLGFKKWERLDKARRCAVDSGWLHYEAPPAGRREAGIYWVKMPQNAARFSDSPMDESSDPIAAQNNTPETDTVRGNDSQKRIPLADTVADTVRGNDSQKRIPLADTVADTVRGNSLPIPIPNTILPIPNTPAGEPPDGYTTDFENFWAAFPKGRKTKKGKAFEAWKKAIKNTAPEVIISAAAEYALSPTGRGQFVLGPAPWLNGHCWNDEREAWGRGDSSGNGRHTTRSIDEVLASLPPMEQKI